MGEEGVSGIDIADAFLAAKCRSSALPEKIIGSVADWRFFHEFAE